VIETSNRYEVLVERIVYIPIEKKNREFASKCLIASELLGHGIVVVIGFYRGVFVNLPAFPRGLVYFKGVNKVQYDYMMHLPGLGHAVVVTDEEALGSSDPKYLMQDCWHDVSRFITKVFCQGEVHRDALSTLRNFRTDQLVITGNSRVDLLRSPFLDALRPRAEEIREQYGPFVLINTDCSSVNGKVTDLDLYRQVLVQIGWVDPTSESDIALMEDHITHDTNNLKAIGDFITAMNRALPARKLVLRPHPTEDIGYWNRLAREVDNLTIVTNTEAPEWILAADILVQTGCTTGVEAAVIGTPSIGLVIQPETVIHPDLLLTHQVNPVVRSIEAAVGAITELDSGEQRRYGSKLEEKWNRLRPHLDIDRSRFAYEKIAGAMTDLLLGLPDVKQPRGLAMDMRAEELLRRVVKKSTFDDAYFSREEIEIRLQSIIDMRSDGTRASVRDLGWGVYMLTPEGDSPLVAT
jgi:surface carbohydrate biosynthesis protein